MCVDARSAIQNVDFFPDTPFDCIRKGGGVLIFVKGAVGVNIQELHPRTPLFCVKYIFLKKNKCYTPSPLPSINICDCEKKLIIIIKCSVISCYILIFVLVKLFYFEGKRGVGRVATSPKTSQLARSYTSSNLYRVSKKFNKFYL